MKISLQKDGPILILINEELKKTITYDLKEKTFYENNKKIFYPQWFFRKTHWSQIETKDEKFKKLLRMINVLNPRYRNIGSLFGMINEVLFYENYLNEGLEIQFKKDSNKRITKPLSFYNRNIINLFKKYNIIIDKDIEDAFSFNYSYNEKLLFALDKLDIPVNEFETKFNVLSNTGIYRWCGNGAELLKELINTYNYDMESLLKYLFLYLGPFENMNYNRGLQLLRDYAHTAKMIGRDFKKYPKYLSSMHDIFEANYNAFKQQYDEEAFKRLYKNELEYEDETYSIIIPKITKDIIFEGTSLNHCVGSYVDKILQGKTYIMFMRLKKAKEISLITLELIGEFITQAKGSYNRPITEIEKKFLEKYCRIKKLKLNETL